MCQAAIPYVAVDHAAYAAHTRDARFLGDRDHVDGLARVVRHENLAVASIHAHMV